LVNVGRRKFLTPLYTALVENGMAAEAKSIFAEAKANYHSVSYNTIEGVLKDK
jgi:leukotriene-A4 hydrolase